MTLVRPQMCRWRSCMQSTSQTAAGTVLVVDDNAMVSRLTCQMLRKAGYVVLAAEDSENALELAATHPAPIDLLLTDVVMPKIGGLELAHRCQELRPDLQVLFVSGYADEATVKVGI